MRAASAADRQKPPKNWRISPSPEVSQTTLFSAQIFVVCSPTWRRCSIYIRLPSTPGAPGLVLFETWDSTVASILGFWLTADRPTDFSSQTSRTESPRLRAKTSAKIEIRLGQFRGTSVRQDGSRNCPKAVFGAIWRVKSLFRNTLPISHLNRILCGDDFAKPFGLNTLRKSGVGGRE